MMHYIHHLLATCALATALPLAAQTSSAPSHHHSYEHSHEHSADSQQAPMTLGEVRKLDLAQGKITLRHGPIAHLEMPAMTMVFPVANRQLLDGLQPGDKVEFHLQRINGAYQVTALRLAKHAD